MLLVRNSKMHLCPPKSFPLACASEKNPPVMQELQEMWVRYLDGGRFPGGGHGNLLQYSCLENAMNRGAWWATVHRDIKSQTGLSMHKLYYTILIHIYHKRRKIIKSLIDVLFPHLPI